ncbi:uncharacterized protein LOC124910505 [Impatiens glandulifera]|uniref:uncharacterized protein LOC124910505 n=1 Tax=Impatiens glandulifera TaxID=253017 RepID=UPI001FB0AF2F|nr:uncharacterized protein LOC124910505 [Impatiens glandulifera]
MTSLLERWEKDPFFSAAEEVQESADRMESIFRMWNKDSPDDQLRRDLQTALGTTKWQLEEFQRATMSSYNTNSADDAKTRHKEFVVAIEANISRIKTSLNETTTSNGKPPLPWVRLDEGERDELAVFLSGAPIQVEKTSTRFHVIGEQPSSDNPQEIEPNGTSKNTRHSVQWNPSEARDQEKQLSGHRRAASANADIGSFKISVSDPDHNVHLLSSNSNQGLGTVNGMEAASSFSCSKKNAYRKIKVCDRGGQEQLNGGCCYERSKSCLNGCDDCDKHIYGWYGAVRRLIQRSQYQVQYCRPIQIIIWSLLLICLIILLVLTVILGISRNN